MKIIDKGMIAYSDMLELQRELFSEMVENKKIKKPIEEEYIFLVEHNPVITLGRHAKEKNLLLTDAELKTQGVELFRIERGGDVTFHGPGQLVVYPIIDLELHHLGVKTYIELLEAAVIGTLKRYGIKGERIEGASGVWIDKGTDRERKICAVGVKCSRFITMHGLALNVNTNLSGFSLINPCGFTDKGVTSMAQEVGNKLDMTIVKNVISEELKKLLDFASE